MLRVYGSEMCPDCLQCKNNFDRYGIEYEYIDINASLRNLKAFLKLRDSDPVFDVCKDHNTIGIPALVREDGSVFLEWDEYLKKQGLEVDYELPKPAEACSLTNRGNC